MKWISSLILLTSLSSTASTFIGNGGQAGDVELAVSLKQIRSATEQIDAILRDDRNKDLCACPEDYADHSLCEIINKLTDEQKKYCSKFVATQLAKFDKAIKTTQFEWVETSMLNQDKVGVRVVDAVAQKDKKKIYIDQIRFIELTGAKRMFLLTHELFHMDKFGDVVLDDEDRIGPFDSEYGVRQLLNAAAAGIVLTSIDEKVYQRYSGYLHQSRTTKRHWFSIYSASTQLQDSKSANFQTEMGGGNRLAYLYQPESMHNFGITLSSQIQSGEKTIFGTARTRDWRSSFSAGISYRHFLFNSMDPLSHFWTTFVQAELLMNRLDTKFSLTDAYTTLESSASSTSPQVRVSIFIPLKYEFWLSAGADFSQHKVYYPEFKYTLEQNSPTFFLGVTYGL